MAGIADLIALGKEVGIFNFYLPFVVLFAIMYGLLMKSAIFGDPTKRAAKSINLIISIAASLFVMIYTPVGITLAEFFSNLFAGTLIVLVTILAILMIGVLILPPLGVKKEIKGKTLGFVIFMIIILGIGVFISSGGTAFFPGLAWGVVPEIPIILFAGVTTQDLAIITIVILTAIVIWWMVREPGLTEKERAELEARRKAMERLRA